MYVCVYVCVCVLLGKRVNAWSLSRIERHFCCKIKCDVLLEKGIQDNESSLLVFPSMSRQNSNQRQKNTLSETEMDAAECAWLFYG